MRDRSLKLVAGVGINDVDIPTKINGIHQTFYVKWNSMLKRCYKGNPLYEGVSVCDRWKHLSNFKNWHDKHYYEIPYERIILDKDIVGDSTLYSPENCCYVPSKMNSFWNSCDLSGVVYDANRSGTKKWRSRVSNPLGKDYQSLHRNKDEAMSARNKYKIELCEEIASYYEEYLPSSVLNIFIIKTKEKYNNDINTKN